MNYELLIESDHASVDDYKISIIIIIPYTFLELTYFFGGVKVKEIGRLSDKSVPKSGEKMIEMFQLIKTVKGT